MAKETNKELIPMYNGEIEMVYYPDSHQYRVAGKRLPSVSSIVGYSNSADGLINWAVGQVLGFMRADLVDSSAVEYHKEQVMMLIADAQNEWERSREKAANLGNYIHALLQGVPFEEPVQEEWIEPGKNALAKFKKWCEQTGYQSTDVERLVYSRKYGYAGRLDDLGNSKFGRHLLDYKTGSIRIKAFAQLAGYGLAYEEETNDRIKKMTIVDIDKETGEVAFINVPMQRSKQVFRNFLRLHQGLLSFTRAKKIKA